MIVVAIVVTSFGFAAVALQAPWLLLVGVFGALAFYVRHWHRVRLERLSPELVSIARKTETMSAIALLIAIILK